MIEYCEVPHFVRAYILALLNESDADVSGKPVNGKNVAESRFVKPVEISNVFSLFDVSQV